MARRRCQRRHRPLLRETTENRRTRRAPPHEKRARKALFPFGFAPCRTGRLSYWREAIAKHDTRQHEKMCKDSTFHETRNTDKKKDRAHKGRGQSDREEVTRENEKSLRV